MSIRSHHHWCLRLSGRECPALAIVGRSTKSAAADYDPKQDIRSIKSTFQVDPQVRNKANLPVITAANYALENLYGGLSKQQYGFFHSTVKRSRLSGLPHPG